MWGYRVGHEWVTKHNTMYILDFLDLILFKRGTAWALWMWGRNGYRSRKRKNKECAKCGRIK